MEASQPEQPGQEPEQPATHESPDSDAGPAVEPTEGTQGESLPQDSSSFDPSNPVRTSALPPEAQSGVPPLPENEGVEPEPENAGPVGDSGQSPGGSHPEASQADNADEGTAPEPGGDPGQE